MSSAFGWLDADDEQRRRMIDVVDLFREHSTLDDLGIGGIRDAFADELFPGTSTAHSRLRYALFVPWLLRRAAAQPTPRQMRRTFDQEEYRLIGALRAGGMSQGVIGRRAGRKLRVWPSTMYWSALQAWGIVREGASLDSCFRRAADQGALRRRAAVPDDPGMAGVGPADVAGVDAGLPPAPDDLLQETTFALRPDEERYLSDKITQHSGHSLLSWLVVNQVHHLPDEPWELPTADMPESMAVTLDHAHRFSVTIHGAHLAYNLLLAERIHQEEMIADYRAALADWERELLDSRVLEGWDLPGFWVEVARKNPHVGLATRVFVERWVQILTAHTSAAAGVPGRLADDPQVRPLVEHRERAVKGRRARLANPTALDAWNGGSGLGRLTYRWYTARSHVQDLYDARELA